MTSPSRFRTNRTNVKTNVLILLHTKRGTLWDSATRFHEWANVFLLKFELPVNSVETSVMSEPIKNAHKLSPKKKKSLKKYLPAIWHLLHPKPQESK